MTSLSNTLFTELSSNTTLLSSLMMDELETFIDKSMQTMVAKDQETTTYYINPKTGGTLIPVSSKMESFTQLLSKRKTFSWRTYNYLFDNVIKKILTLTGEYTFEQSLNEIEKFREKAGKHFYGAVLRASSEKLINPYHILTPISYAKHPEAFTNTKYKVLIYFYSNRSKAEAELGTTKDLDYINELLNNIIKCSNHKVETIVPNNLEAVLNYPYVRTTRNLTTGSNLASIANLRLDIISADEITEEAYNNLDYSSVYNLSSSDTMLLASHQIMVNGVFAPDYGVSLLRKGKNGLNGTFLTPSVSANIQSSSVHPLLTWSGVCTGRESQRTLEGISSLHCCNYASAYNHQGHSSGSIAFADLSIERSVDLYRKFKLLPTILPSMPTDEELEVSKDFMAYIEYMISTYNLDLPQIEARYQLIIGQTHEQKIEKPSDISSSEPVQSGNSETISSESHSTN